MLNEERGIKTGARVTQGSSVQAGHATLATAGLICETRFGVFRLRDEVASGGRKLRGP